MRSSLIALSEEGDHIQVYQTGQDQVKIVFETIIIKTTNKQLLDLGMKIQAVVNQIDRENRDTDERRLMETKVD